LKESISIDQFIQAILDLPSDKPFVERKKSYTTQKEHWLRWLGDYDGPGYYGRTSKRKRDAKFAYNHIVEPKMLAWLIEASGTRPELASKVRSIMATTAPMQRKSSTIRKLVPWSDVANKLFR
jgi:hypothetical protein